jgi:HEAT repeat protein
MLTKTGLFILITILAVFAAAAFAGEQKSAKEQAEEEARKAALSKVAAAKTALESPNIPERVAALKSLADTTFPEALEVISIALDDRESAVRTEAIAILKNFPLPKKSDKPAASDAAITAVYKKALADSEPLLRVQAVRILSGDRDAIISILPDSISDSDARVRLETALRLGAFGAFAKDDALYGIYKTALADTDVSVRIAAVRGLKANACEASAELLAIAQNDTDERVRLEAVKTPEDSSKTSGQK